MEYQCVMSASSGHQITENVKAMRVYFDELANLLNGDTETYILLRQMRGCLEKIEYALQH